MRTAAPRGGRLLPAAAGGLALFAFAAMGLMIAAAAAYVLLANTHPRGLFLLYACVPALCLAGAAVLLPAERLGRRAFLILLFTAALVLKGTVALTVTPRLESDFYLLHYAADQLARGNNILNDAAYFQLWPYQSFFVAVLAGVMKLFGSSPVVFRLMNALLSALTNLLVYALARRFASERGARLAGLLFLLYPGTFFLIPLLTNQHLSECLLLAAFWACTAPAERLPGRLWRGGAGGGAAVPPLPGHLLPHPAAHQPALVGMSAAGGLLGLHRPGGAAVRPAVAGRRGGRAAGPEQRGAPHGAGGGAGPVRLHDIPTYGNLGGGNPILPACSLTCVLWRPISCAAP